MAKDTYYFSHDHNARNDRKIAALIRDYKSSGYGVFWVICEMMHEEGGSLEFDDMTLSAIAKDLNEEISYITTIVKACIDVYKLFVLDNEILNSGRVNRNLEQKNEKNKKKVEAGRLGGINSGISRSYSNTLKQNEAERSGASSNEPKESKVKEIKGKESKGNEMYHDSVCYDVEKYLLDDSITLESVFMKAGKQKSEINSVKKELHLYHLWMEKNEKYPVGKKAVRAGFESWLLNGKKYGNGQNTTTSVGKSIEFDKA